MPAPQAHELNSNEERNYSEPWFQFLDKLLKSFITLQFSIPDLWADSYDMLSPSSTPIENNRKG
jgi:hypothetical protein